MPSDAISRFYSLTSNDILRAFQRCAPFDGEEKGKQRSAEAHRDLLSQLEHGYQLETDSLGGNPVLRRLEDGDVLRPADANASTVKALQERGLIAPGKGRDPLTIAWHLKTKK